MNTCPDCSNHPCDCGIPAGYTPTPRTDEWETYCDEWYYHMWRLRRKTERGWHDGFHIQKGDEAKGLCDILNNLEAELIAVTEQRDSLHELHNKNAARSKELLELCGTLRKELTAVTEQRDEARRLAERYRNLSCDSQEEADETLLPWENNQTNEP